jgi:hypothetical protein
MGKVFFLDETFQKDETQRVRRLYKVNSIVEAVSTGSVLR